MIIRHIYLRGNYREDIFFDEIDMTSAWNRIWIAANITDTQILAVQLLSNHFHICARFDCETEYEADARVSDFIHFLRMSLSQYFNRRYDLHGSLGCRRYGKGHILDPQVDNGIDLSDVIRYILRNVTHHGITPNFEDWKYSTFRCLYDQFAEPDKCYTLHTAPKSLVRTILPYRRIPDGWLLRKDGMIVPPSIIFPKKELEKFFGNRTLYYQACNTKTRRENDGEKHERLLGAKRFSSNKISDHDISEFILNLFHLSPVKMARTQRREAVRKVHLAFPEVKVTQLSRILSIPPSTLKYWIKKGLLD